MKYKSFRDMGIWQGAIDIAVNIFEMTESLPRKEDYGFTSQLRRSSLSISANIAEAFGREHRKDKINFYYIARGSVAETQSHLEYGQRVGYFQKSEKDNICDKLDTLYEDLNKLLKALKAMVSTKPKP